MSSKVSMFLLGALVSAILAAALFAVGLAMGINIETKGDPQEAFCQDISPEEMQVLFEPYWEAWDILHDYYVEQPLDDVELMQGSIRGLVDSLGDPHSSYMDPIEFEQANATLEGYEGIGAWVDTDAEYLTILAPIPGSPAEEVGLQPGDQVITIDGEDMTGIDGNLVIQRILGPAGTMVHLSIYREGETELLEFDIERAHIIIPTVEGENLEDGIVYIELFSFAETTADDLRAKLTDLIDEDTRGLILDLRNNAGGYLFSAIDVASEFIDEGVVVTERFGDGTEEIHKAQKGGLATDIPLVVLVNAGSASASEIVAGAIQDYDRGILVGETTFGKGSVQQWIPLSSDQGAVRVTIAQWYTPNDRLIHGQGLTPDVEVELTLEDWDAGNDTQLKAAIELLLDESQIE
jgi:carboxyl-terminal processing protease